MKTKYQFFFLFSPAPIVNSTTIKSLLECFGIQVQYKYLIDDAQSANADALAKCDAHLGAGEHRRDARPHSTNTWSNADGADIRYKMGQKAKNGGALGQAKFSHLSVRDTIDGREIRTVATDPERAPFVQLALSWPPPGSTRCSACPMC